ncbi:nitrogenase cofactor biosynthesis protein NifB [Gorillibacterium timonense]|uniref:nitrogenase cofactor biosynthesis protein NifB n=1 Tax=Gorillibacterium timonense TaxID=1689269 RepID=UPI00071D1873|nr:nitrogenase cofactor biosynthesis protein NifB [Gorillibacterium timonense]
MDTAALKHPCYNESAHHHFARMHAAVAPKCNISCNYCNRKCDCVNESRPGVTSRVLTPEEAFERVSETAARLPSLSVVGIAGPGDPLANPNETFRTFRLIAAVYPEMQLCLSTNGLALPDYADELVKLGVSHVTVTMNTVDPAIAAQIYTGISYRGKAYRGREAGEILIAQQLEGIRMMAERDVLVKVNSVFIPEFGEEQMAEVSRTVKELGAFSHNIMPLILSPGSLFEKIGMRPPAAEEMIRVQQASSQIMPVMRHCRQCRADAIGLIGADMSQELDRLPQTIRYEREERLTLQEELADRSRRGCGNGEPADCEWKNAVRIAVATRGSGMINQHFGHAREFLVYEVMDRSIRLLGARKVQAYCNGTAECGDGSGSRKAAHLEELIELVKDCELLLCSGIGPHPAENLQRAGVLPLVRKGAIQEQLVESARLYRLFAPLQ